MCPDRARSFRHLHVADLDLVKIPKTRRTFQLNESFLKNEILVLFTLEKNLHNSNNGNINNHRSNKKYLTFLKTEIEP